MYLDPPEPIDEIARTVIGAAIEVHRHLGPGFIESIYEEALAVELVLRGITVHRQVVTPVFYKERLVGESRLDLFIEGGLVVELKAVDELHPVHVSQVISYLRATGAPLGLLINFNVRLLRDGIRRIVLDSARRPFHPATSADPP